MKPWRPLKSRRGFFVFKKEATMATKGEAKPQYTEEQKRVIVQTVCDYYASQQCTLESACNAAGISVRAFYLWKQQNAEFAGLYKKAVESQQNDYWENIIKPLAHTGLQRMLKGEKVKEIKSKGERQANGDFVVTEQTVTEKEILPHPSLLMFVHKGLHPEMFVEHTKVEGEIKVADDSWFAKLPFESQLEILRIRNAATTNAGDTEVTGLED